MLGKFGHICVSPSSDAVSTVHPVQPFVILESECTRPPVRRHPEYIQNKTWLEYTTHVNDVSTMYLGEKVILSRSLKQKRAMYNREMDATKWQNPYETLIGEPINTEGRQFNEEDYIKAPIVRSRGKRLFAPFSESATKTKSRSKRRAITVNPQEKISAMQRKKTIAESKWDIEARERKERMEAMAFESDNYQVIIDKFNTYVKQNPKVPYTNKFSNLDEKVS